MNSSARASAKTKATSSVEVVDILMVVSKQKKSSSHYFCVQTQVGFVPSASSLGGVCVVSLRRGRN